MRSSHIRLRSSKNTEIPDSGWPQVLMPIRSWMPENERNHRPENSGHRGRSNPGGGQPRRSTGGFRSPRTLVGGEPSLHPRRANVMQKKTSQYTTHFHRHTVTYLRSVRSRARTSDRRRIHLKTVVSLMSATTALPGNGCFHSKQHSLPISNLFVFSSSFLLILSYLSTLPVVPVFAVAPPPAKSQGVWPSFGSLAGGTYLVIRGVGWTRGGLPGTTRAFINNKECIQNQGVILDSTDTNFVCWTPPHFAPGQEFPNPEKDWWAVNSRFDVRVEITTGMASGKQVPTPHFMNFQFTVIGNFVPVAFARVDCAFASNLHFFVILCR